MTPTSDDRTLAVDVSVLPMRFTDNLVRMREFLALLGLSAKVSRQQDWVTMAGAAGLVALHSLASTSPDKRGRTELWFETTDLQTLRDRFIAAGFDDTNVYDEAYGRELTVRDQDGRELGFDQPSDDLYGYRRNEPRPEHGIIPMPILSEDPDAGFDRLLLPAGFRRLDEEPAAGYAVFAGRGGLLALHRPTDQEPPGTVRLGFRTREPLAELAARLLAAGYPDVEVSGAYDGQLTVTDPDGQRIVVESRTEP